MIGDLPDPLVKLSIQLRVAKRVGPGHAASHFDEHLAQLAEIGLYSPEFLAQTFADETGIMPALVAEELCWGCAGIALAIQGTGLPVAAIYTQGTPEQVAAWIPDPDAGVQRLNRGKGPAGCPPGRSVSNTGFHG
ncbi:MAG: acyl-CoA dehydrogenase family protein [Chloroflexi bacterium]|nr:MAG: acyl-CoA dehydrogenase family protein [Chloroflexota bacterium]